MRKVYFLFGATFFVLATSSTLLLTWTSWWMSLIGPSVPARRPFYNSATSLPELLRVDNSLTDLLVYEYTLQGGWPTFNSIIRLLTSMLGVLCSFTFAILANLQYKFQVHIYSIFFFAIICFAVFSSILDAITIVKTETECNLSKCITNVPDVVLNSDNICICSVEGWFYVTLFVDIVIACTALICFVILIRPNLAATILNQSYLGSNVLLEDNNIDNHSDTNNNNNTNVHSDANTNTNIKNNINNGSERNVESS